MKTLLQTFAAFAGVVAVCWLGGAALVAALAFCMALIGS